MSWADGIWAVVPVKNTAAAKQRLSSALSAALRQEFALAMLEDVLAALADVPDLVGRIIVTTDLAAAKLAARYRFQTHTQGANEGHTAAVTSAARLLQGMGDVSMLTSPGDIPLVTPAEIGQLIAAHRPAPSFTIAPSHDERGSNAILMSPPEAVKLAFGENSFFPHLAAAEACGIAPTVLHLAGIAFDIDNPADLAHFARLRSGTRAGRLLAESGWPRNGAEARLGDEDAP
jgi:2-phospho-L-lactate guanylyltransferase